MANAQFNTAELQPNSIEHKALLDSASQHYTGALENADDGLLDKAHDLAIRAYEQDPNYLPGINLLARIELQRQHISQANKWATLGLRIKPDSASLLYSAGHIALAKGDLDQAEQLFAKSSRISRVSTKAPVFLAHVKLLKGEFTVAFEQYRELAKTRSDDPQVLNKLIEASSHIVADGYTLDLEQDVIRYLNYSDIDYSGLRNLATSLLKHKLQLSSQGCPVDFHVVVSDPLLINSLKKFYFTDPLIEQLLSTIRRSLLISCGRSLSIDHAYIPMINALAIQNSYNEYIWQPTEEEVQLVDRLSNLLEKMLNIDTITIDDIYPVFLLISMYQPINTQEYFEQFIPLAEQKQKWPTAVHELLTLLIEEPIELAKLSKSIITAPFTHPSEPNKVSQKVALQYNENPYPRWTTLGYQQKANYHLAVRALFSGKVDDLSSRYKQLNVLVAGCGTGRHALTLSLYFDRLNVVALDLSHSALAYAKRQSKRYDAKNISFIQGDILEIDHSSPQFDVIETSGVLHHMEDPVAGLQKLVTQLKPGGLIKIGLYSATARQSIGQLRSLLSELSIRTVDDIRYVRSALLENQIPGDWQDIFQSVDFYSLSACRDLLFHEQEHVYDYESLQQFINQSGCEWVGMVPPALSYNLIENNNEKPTSLKDWCELEQHNPTLFSGMYQFYLRKPKDSQLH